MFIYLEIFEKQYLKLLSLISIPKIIGNVKGIIIGDVWNSQLFLVNTNRHSAKGLNINKHAKVAEW